jgi:hypothetical protein
LTSSIFKHLLALAALLPTACSDSAGEGAPPPLRDGSAKTGNPDSGGGGSSGQSAGGSAGSGASSGASGSTGLSGSAGTGGAAGSAGSGAGSSGSSGSGGSAGADAGPSDSGPPSDAGQPTGTAAVVAVGYAGLRVTSYDRARSWTNKRTLSDTAADDPNNLRGVTYGAGLFVAVGHKIFTSPDGETWTQRQHPKNDAQWLGDVKYGNGRFVATGGYGYSAWSSDGITWREGGSIGTEASRSLAFGNGEFRTQTDPGNWYRSTNGESWALESGGHSEKIAFCNGGFRNAPDCGPAFGHGVYVRAGGWNSGTIDWSDNGQSWNKVTVGYPGGVNGFAFGYRP